MTDDECAAVEDGLAALEKLSAGLADRPVASRTDTAPADRRRSGPHSVLSCRTQGPDEPPLPS